MKKRILIIAMSFIVLVMTIAGATTAYFTDTDKATNVFTVGKVDIQLTETVADPIDGTVTESVVDGNKVYNYGKVYPGQTYTKQPIITNIGSEEAFVGATITLSNVNPTVTADASILNVLTDDAKVKAFFGGLVSDGYTVNVNRDTANNKIVITIVYLSKTAPTGKLKLFDSVVIPAEWGNTQMANLENLNVVVDAYAVQSVGLEAQGAAAALHAAFESVFPAPTNP